MNDPEARDIIGNNVQEFVLKVMQLGDTDSRYYQKYGNRYLMEYLDRPKLQSVEKMFNSTNKKMGLLEFVRFFLNIISHQPLETLYLTMALVDAFRQIATKTKEKEVTFLDLTNHFCEIITQKDSQIKIPIKLYPAEKCQNPNLKTVRGIDKKAPTIHERVTLTLPKITVDKVKTDKTPHSTGPVKQVVYSPDLNKVFALDTLSPSIKIFDTSLNFKRELIPQHNGKTIKDLAILCFAYSNRQKRIGCIVKDIGMSFWEASDDFFTEKKIVKTFGEKIYYFQLFEQWATTDKSSTHFWDIKEEKIKFSLDGIPGSTINSICQIPLLRVICVAYTGTEAHKQLVLYQNFREIARMPLGHAGCHTLHYNKTTQTLLPIGYRITIPVYQVHPQYYDFTLLAQLKGHTSLVTCVTDVLNTTLICSGDDIGCIRVWDLRTMKCVQVVKVARWLSYLLYIEDSKLIFTDSRINLINFQKFKNCMVNKETIHPLSVLYQSTTNTIVVATAKQFRKYDAQKGELIEVYQIALDDEITVFKRLPNGNYITGTEQGRLRIFNHNGETLSDIQAHSNEVSDIKIDSANKILVTGSWDSDIHIWRENFKDRFEGGIDTKAKLHSVVRSIRNNHFSREVSLLQISLFQNIIVTGSVDSRLFIWDFECGKLGVQILLSAEPVCMTFVDIFSILIVGCGDGFSYIFKFERKEARLLVRLQGYIVSSLDSGFELAVFSTQVQQRVSSKRSLLSNLSSEQKEKILIPSHFLVDMTESGFNMYIGYSKGRIQMYQFDKSSPTMPLEESTSQTNKHNYTPFRPNSQDFNNEYLKNQFSRTDVLEEASKANKFNLLPTWSSLIHKDCINSLGIMDASTRYLLSTSLDGYYKIVSLLSGVVVTSMNINHALPMRWDLKLDPLVKAKDRILLALKTIQMIMRKFQVDITTTQSKHLSLKKFMAKIKDAASSPRVVANMPQLFADEYEPIDLNPSYPRVKQKPTLKELEAYKRVYLNGFVRNRDSLVDKNKLPKVITSQKLQDRDQFQFLSPYYMPKLINKGVEVSNQADAQFMRGLGSIFDNTRNNTQENLPTIRGKDQKQQTDYIQHARNKNYLLEESQNMGESVSRLLVSLNTKKESSKRTLNRGNAERRLQYSSTLNSPAKNRY